jgi:predicted GNAT family acetyltransferase
MKPFDYLLHQIELEGIKRVSSDLISRTSSDVDDFPLILIARTSDGESLVCFDELISEEICNKLSKDDLQAFKIESAIEVFEKSGIHAKASRFKTYIFPDSFKSAKVETVGCFSQDDPKLIAFGFNGLADKVFAIENKGVILSACVSSRQNSKSAEASVFTHSDYRRKGLAQQVVTAWASHMQNEGLIPFYSHTVENANSALVAKRLNLIQVFEETVIEKVS